MTITPRLLIGSAGSCAVLAGMLFVVIQFIHPHEDVASVTTTAWTLTHTHTLAMSVVALVGITEVYLRQVTAAGLLGRVGYLLFGIALFRAAVLARWAALTLAVGTVLTLALPLVPHTLGRMTALPVGLGLAGPGISLWRESGASARSGAGTGLDSTPARAW